LRISGQRPTSLVHKEFLPPPRLVLHNLDVNEVVCDSLLESCL
jgi:hypothetical protein